MFVFVMLSPHSNVGEGTKALFQAISLFVHSSGQILLPWYLMNDLYVTYREYSLAPTDDLIRLWRSKVKVIEGVEIIF